MESPPDAEHRFSIRQQHRAGVSLPVGFSALRDDHAAISRDGKGFIGSLRKMRVPIKKRSRDVMRYGLFLRKAMMPSARVVCAVAGAPG